MLTNLLITVIGVEYLGLAATFGILKATKFSLLVSLGLFALMASRNGLGKLVSFTQVRLILTLTAMSIASVLYAFVQTYVLDTVISQIGYFIMLANVYWLVDNSRKIRRFYMAMVSFLVYLVVLNYDMFFQAVRVGYFKAGYFLGDGNDFAWALVTFLPLTIVLYRGSGNFILRTACLGAAALMIIGILGSGSRGATLGLSSQILLLIMISKRKVLAISLVAVAVAGALMFVPGTYTNRMSTLKHVDQDSSAQARLTAWKAATMMAMDHPLGVGAHNFNSAYGRIYKDKVIKEETWGSGRWISPHSIYFLTLAEYGFPGLLLLLGLLFTAIRTNLKMHRESLTDPHPDLPQHFFLALSLSLVGFSACGVFLGGVNYPHIFILMGLSIRGFQMMSERDANRGEPVSAGKAPRSPGGRRGGSGPRPPRRPSSRGRRNTANETG